MNEVKITYETLFDLLRREKDREELQELDETFYNDVLDYLGQKQSFMNDSSAQGDMFGASETEKTRVQIQNIKKIIKDLFERRQQKILRLAVNNSKVNSSLFNTITMLPEEKVFFEQSLAVLSRNRADVLNKILFFGNGNGYSAPAQQPTQPVVEPKKEDTTPEPEPVEELEEGEIAEPTEEPETEVPQIEPEEEKNSTSALKNPDDIVESVQEADTAVEEEVTIDEQASDDSYETKIKVRFKGTVPKFVGKKMELYGPYNEGDEDELPKIIANILLNKDKAEEI